MSDLHTGDQKCLLKYIGSPITLMSTASYTKVILQPEYTVGKHYFCFADGQLRHEEIKWFFQCQTRNLHQNGENLGLLSLGWFPEQSNYSSVLAWINLWLQIGLVKASVHHGMKNKKEKNYLTQYNIISAAVFFSKIIPQNLKVK